MDTQNSPIQALEVTEAQRASTKMLLALSRTGKHVYEGTVPAAVVAKRRASAVHLRGLPEPRYVTIDRHQIGVQLSSPAEVTAWAAWLDVEVNSERVTDNEGRIHTANGERNGLRVNAYHVEYGEAAA